MPNFKCTYTFEEEVNYPSKGEAQQSADEFAQGVADDEELHVVKVEVEEVK